MSTNQETNAADRGSELTEELGPMVPERENAEELRHLRLHRHWLSVSETGSLASKSGAP